MIVGSIVHIIYYLFFYDRVVNVEQNNILISFTEQNPKLLKSGSDCFNLKDVKDKYIYDRLWKEITQDLNEAGPPFKTSTDWKQVIYIF